jgi:hypothetical protein
MANLNSEIYHSLIGFLTPEYLGFLKLQVVPRFTCTCISPVPVNRNWGTQSIPVRSLGLGMPTLTCEWACSVGGA